MTFGYLDAYQVDKSFVTKTKKKITEEISLLKKNLKKKYQSPYASFYLPKDKKNIEEMIRVAKKYKKYDTIIVVGIGGSNLGTIAVIESMFGKNVNLTHSKNIFFADTVDSYAMHEISSFVEEDLKAKKKVLVNVISKSGGTTETIANFEVFYTLLEKYKQDVKKHIVITSDKNSKLWDFGVERKIPVLEIPKFVGGRYSVFSPVGLFPLAAYGVDIKALLEGARAMSENCLSLVHSGEDNPAFLSALQLAFAHSKGINIVEQMFFEGKLESLGKWYRQLMGESLGKQYDKQGKEVFNGLTPTVAIGSTDLHSIAQLYLGGPWDKYVTFVQPETIPVVMLPVRKEFDALVSHIQGKQLDDMMSAIIEGIQGAFLQQGRAFNAVALDSNDPYDIGAFMQWKMFEIVFLAKLMNVNPFDQENVEEYKVITKKVLEGND